MRWIRAGKVNPNSRGISSAYFVPLKHLRIDGRLVQFVRYPALEKKP